jgi:hypothetical protein
MPVEDNIDDLINDILKITEYTEKNIPRELVEFATQLQGELQAGNFKNRTGNLRRSMNVAVEGTSVKIAMLFYGYFLSFGVDGRKRKGAFGLTPDVAEAFGEPVGYKFGSRTNSKYVAGINARRFYPEDITDTIINILEKPYE